MAKIYSTGSKNTGMIQFHSMSANNLPKADVLSESDPYVVITSKSGVHTQSKAIDGTADPIWNENLVLPVNENDTINISIYDEDPYSRDDLLCSMTLDIRSKCTDGKEVNLKDLRMKVKKKFKKQHRKPTISFTVLYQSFNVLKTKKDDC